MFHMFHLCFTYVSIMFAYVSHMFYIVWLMFHMCCTYVSLMFYLCSTYVLLMYSFLLYGRALPHHWSTEPSPESLLNHAVSLAMSPLENASGEITTITSHDFHNWFLSMAILTCLIVVRPQKLQRLIRRYPSHRSLPAFCMLWMGIWPGTHRETAVSPCLAGLAVFTNLLVGILHCKSQQSLICEMCWNHAETKDTSDRLRLFQEPALSRHRV